jgi:hypothetical protein
VLPSSRLPQFPLAVRRTACRRGSGRKESPAVREYRRRQSGSAPDTSNAATNWAGEATRYRRASSGYTTTRKAPPCSCCAWRKRPATVTVTMRSAAHTFRTPCTYSAISNSLPRRCRMRSIPRMLRDCTARRRTCSADTPGRRHGTKAQAFSEARFSELCGWNFVTMSSCDGPTSAQLLEKSFVSGRDIDHSLTRQRVSLYVCVGEHFLCVGAPNALDGQGDHAASNTPPYCLTFRGSSGYGIISSRIYRSITPLGKSVIHSRNNATG